MDCLAGGKWKSISQIAMIVGHLIPPEVAMRKTGIKDFDRIDCAIQRVVSNYVYSLRRSGVLSRRGVTCGRNQLTHIQYALVADVGFVDDIKHKPLYAQFADRLKRGPVRLSDLKSDFYSPRGHFATLKSMGYVIDYERTDDGDMMYRLVSEPKDTTQPTGGLACPEAIVVNDDDQS